MSDYRLMIHMQPKPHDNPDKPYFWCILEYVNGLTNKGSGWSSTPEQAFQEGFKYLKERLD